MLKIRCRGYEGVLKHMYMIFDTYEITMSISESESVHLAYVNDDEIEFIKEDEER